VRTARNLFFDPFYFKLEVLLALTMPVSGTATMMMTGTHQVTCSVKAF
jgi:hypothetical protein